MKHLITIAMFLMMALPLLAAPAAAQPGDNGGPGNSGAAHACQDDGYLDYTRADGSGFANTGECVSYAAQGGVLVEASEGGGDEGGGNEGGSNGQCADYENLAPPSNPSLNLGFESEQECLDYINGGGTVVAYDSTAPQVFLFSLGKNSLGLCNVGVGLKRFPANTSVSVAILRSGTSHVSGSPFTLTTNADGDTNPVDPVVGVSSGMYTTSASTGGQTYSHTVLIDC